MDLFKLLGTIAIDNSEANKALDETSQKGEKTESKLSKAFTKVGKGAAVVGKAVATGLAAGGAAMGALTFKALNMSGELEQNMGGSEAVFKKYAGSVQSTAKEAFSKMGLSTSDYLATANKMGALFQGAGFSIKDSMSLSSESMQRAADVASIMGIDTSAAMEAIAGAAKGNFTMMDNLGVAMNDTTLQAYALEKGISKSTTEMTNQEKIGLAMEMFMEKTAYAAGNYAKENETLAGSLGTAKAAFTNFLDGSGSVDDLVSAFSSAADVIIKNVSEIAPRLISGISELLNKVIPMLPPLLQKLLPVIITGAVSLINGLVDALPMIISTIMGALPALIEGVQQIINALIEALPQIIQTLAAALPTLIPLLVEALVGMIVTLCSNFAQIIQPLIDYLPEIMVSIVSAIIENLPVLIQGCITLIGGLIAALPQILSALWEALKGVFGTLGTKMAEWFKPVTDWFKSAWEKLTDIVSNVWETIKAVISTAFKLIGSIISAAFQIITLPFRLIWENCKEYVFAAWEWIKSKIKTAVNAVKDIVQLGFKLVKEKIINPITDAKNKAVEIFTNIKNSITDKITAVKNKVSDIFGSIRDKISNVFSGIKSNATNTWNDIKNKMTQPIETAKSKIKGIVDSIKGFFDKMKLKLPKIKLPHFKVTGKLSISPPSVPKLSIEWYKKAMNNPMLLNDPTIFGYNPATGSFMGGGEAGAEVVSGATSLMKMIQGAVATENSAVVYYLQKLVEILADYFPQVLEALDFDFGFDADLFIKRHTPGIDKELGRLHAGKVRGR